MRSMPNGPTAVARAPVEVQLLDDKIQDVARYIHSHAHPQHSEQVEPSGQLMNLQMDSNSRLVTVMHPAGYPSQVCRQVSLGGEGVLAEGGGWVGEELIGTELTEEDGRLAAALVAVHLANSNSRVTQVRQDVEQTVLMGGNMRLFNNQGMGAENEEPIVVEVPALPQLPPLQDMSMKDNTWYHNKTSKEPLKGAQHREPTLVEVPTLPQLPSLQEMSLKDNTWYHTKTSKEPLKGDAVCASYAGQEEHRAVGEAARAGLRSPAQGKHSRKSLPHKKRISRKLRRAGGGAGGDSGAGTPRRDPSEEILPDGFGHARPDAMHGEHHIVHEVRPILICQICGDFYGEEQLKFFHHLKQHYEPQGATIIIENPVGQMQPVGELALDKMNTCIVDNVAPLPEALVELSLESSVTGKMSLYHERHAPYASGDKTLPYAGNKCAYTTAAVERDAYVEYDAREPVYACTRCSRTFRRQKACEAHIKEAHSNKVDEMSEFSEPEDLMEGIHVLVEGGEGGEGGVEVEVAAGAGAGGAAAGGFLTVEGGHVHQEHIKHWYQLTHAPAATAADSGEVGGGGGDACADCAEPLPTRDVLGQHINHCPMHLKEEVLQRIFESEVDSGNNASLSPAMMLDTGEIHESAKHQEAADIHRESDHQRRATAEELTTPKEEATKEIGKKKKVFECQECQREFKHRNSLLYHLMSHNGLRSHKCTNCEKAFFTPGALKVHERIHNGSKPYKCVHCDKQFRQWGDLKYHVVSLHTAKKNYKCGYCSKEFARKYSLNVHIRIHTGERNYQCEFCNKSFRASSYRLSHMRTHTGERPFSCDVCGKRFRVAGDMRRHQLTHEKRADEGKPRRGKKPVLVKLVNIKIRKEPPKSLLARAARRAKHDEEILPDRLGDEPPPCGDDVELRKRLEHDRYRSDAYECDSKLELRPGDSPPRNITPFEHLQKRDASGAHTQIHISDIRSYATKPEDVIPSESLENTFIERLTAMYSIAPIT